jgi:hypothetical protein
MTGHGPAHVSDANEAYAHNSSPPFRATLPLARAEERFLDCVAHAQKTRELQNDARLRSE